MNAIVIGLGSMGQRRIRLMKKMYPDLVICGVDAQPVRRESTANKWNITTYATVGDAVAAIQPEIALVCTPPLTHASIIYECLKNRLHVFTELNLVSDGYEENMALARKNGRTLFLSSTFLYRDETRYICDQVHAQRKTVSYRYHVGQYLPDWHPWESFTDYFIGDPRTNGCRELLAIELPWLIQAFGETCKIKVSRRKLSTLNISYDDCILLLMEHKNGTIGSVCVDVVSRKAVRKFELIGEDIYLSWDGTPDSLTLFDENVKQDVAVRLTNDIDQQEGYAAFVIENAYANELRAFIDTVNGGASPEYGFAEDIKTLELIDMIEASE